MFVKAHGKAHGKYGKYGWLIWKMFRFVMVVPSGTPSSHPVMDESWMTMTGWFESHGDLEIPHDETPIASFSIHYYLELEAWPARCCMFFSGHWFTQQFCPTRHQPDHIFMLPVLQLYIRHCTFAINLTVLWIHRCSLFKPYPYGRVWTLGMPHHLLIGDDDDYYY